MKSRFIRLLALAIVLSAGYLVGCKKQEYQAATTDDVNIVGYLRRYSDSFSLFQQILDRTENTSFLNAYGNYTCFAPTNGGVKTWLTQKGYANVDAADLNVLKDLVRFHLLYDTITTGSFKDGKLPVPTMYGQFLITGVAFKNGSSSYTVNRQADVIKSNVKVGNGIIHEIDHVLEPSHQSIAQQLEANPDYSIFVQAMKETGLYEKLNTVDPDTSKRWMTVMAETNAALADSGFDTYAKLKAKYSKTGNPRDEKDSLHMYVAYHITEGLYFLGDIINYSTQLTLLPQEVISVKLINQEVVLNEDEFNGVLEKGVKLARSVSDNSATNGVWHSAGGHYMAKYRKPTALFWDVCTFPEITSQPGFYKKQSLAFVKPSQEARPIESIDWHYTQYATTVTYSYGTGGTIYQSSVNYDLLLFPFGTPNRSTWIDFKTPVVIKGRYKVWICYVAVNAVTMNVFVNGTQMARPVNFGEARPSGTDPELESIGWKRYAANTTSYRNSGRYVGVIDIPTTGRQVVRFGVNNASTNASNYLDMIHFIPIDDNQINIRFDNNGEQVLIP